MSKCRSYSVWIQKSTFSPEYEKIITRFRPCLSDHAPTKRLITAGIRDSIITLYELKDATNGWTCVSKSFEFNPSSFRSSLLHTSSSSFNSDRQTRYVIWLVMTWAVNHYKLLWNIHVKFIKMYQTGTRKRKGYKRSVQWSTFDLSKALEFDSIQLFLLFSLFHSTTNYQSPWFYL